MQIPDSFFKKLTRGIHAFIVVVLLVVSSPLIKADTLAGRIVGVSDGDTLTLLDDAKSQHKIRLGGIDAPEKKQPFGQRSKETLSDFVYDKQVVVEWSKRDRYGRIVGKVLVDGRDVNIRMVSLGMAWHYKEYQKEQSVEDRRSYSEAEEIARSAKKGLWQDLEPTPPWEFRRATR